MEKVSHPPIQVQLVRPRSLAAPTHCSSGVGAGPVFFVLRSLVLAAPVVDVVAAATNRKVKLVRATLLRFTRLSSQSESRGDVTHALQRATLLPVFPDTCMAVLHAREVQRTYGSLCRRATAVNDQIT